MTDRQERRHQLLSQRTCRFVEAGEFLDYATSRHHLLRCDEPEAGVHGLLDPATGMRFLIEEEKLFTRAVSGR